MVSNKIEQHKITALKIMQRLTCSIISASHYFSQLEIHQQIILSTKKKIASVRSSYIYH